RTGTVRKEERTSTNTTACGLVGTARPRRWPGLASLVERGAMGPRQDRTACGLPGTPGARNPVWRPNACTGFRPADGHRFVQGTGAQRRGRDGSSPVVARLQGVPPRTLAVRFAEHLGPNHLLDLISRHAALDHLLFQRGLDLELAVLVHQAP